MQNNAIKLPESFINKLINLPESGMGYQIVKVILRNGRVLKMHKVFNSEILMLEENELIQAIDIVNIELENK
jgi:hypothetical protein